MSLILFKYNEEYFHRHWGNFGKSSKRITDRITNYKNTVLESQGNFSQGK